MRGIEEHEDRRVPDGLELPEGTQLEPEPRTTVPS